MGAAWLVVKTFFGGLPAWVVPALAGAVAVGAIVFGVYHAGEASARATTAEALARNNAAVAKTNADARDKAVDAFREADAKALKNQAAVDSLKEEIARVAKGNASAGCRTAVLGVLKRADTAAGSAVVPRP